MIDFEEELKNFEPSIEITDAEEAIVAQDMNDMTDLLIRMTESGEAKRGR